MLLSLTVFDVSFENEASVLLWTTFPELSKVCCIFPFGVYNVVLEPPPTSFSVFTPSSVAPETTFVSKFFIFWALLNKLPSFKPTAEACLFRFEPAILSSPAFIEESSDAVLVSPPSKLSLLTLAVVCSLALNIFAFDRLLKLSKDEPLAKKFPAAFDAWEIELSWAIIAWTVPTFPVYKGLFSFICSFILSRAAKFALSWFSVWLFAYCPTTPATPDVIPDRAWKLANNINPARAGIPTIYISAAMAAWFAIVLYISFWFASVNIPSGPDEVVVLTSLS